MKTYDYTCKVGVEFSSNRELRTTKPVTQNTFVIDLGNGRRYQVLSIHAAKPTDRVCSTQPDTVVHLWPAGSLSEDELRKLRDKEKYTPDELPVIPLADVVFFPA